MHGLGIETGPNKNVLVDVQGFVGPLGTGSRNSTSRCRPRGVTSEPALRSAYPPPVREALKIFDAPGKGEYPQYHGGFIANVHRPYGPGPEVVQTVVDVDLDDAQRLADFLPVSCRTPDRQAAHHRGLTLT